GAGPAAEGLGRLAGDGEAAAQLADGRAAADDHAAARAGGPGAGLAAPAGGGGIGHCKFAASDNWLTGRPMAARTTWRRRARWSSTGTRRRGPLRAGVWNRPVGRRLCDIESIGGLPRCQGEVS